MPTGCPPAVTLYSFHLLPQGSDFPSHKGALGSSLVPPGQTRSCSVGGARLSPPGGKQPVRRQLAKEGKKYKNSPDGNRKFFLKKYSIWKPNHQAAASAPQLHQTRRNSSWIKNIYTSLLYLSKSLRLNCSTTQTTALLTLGSAPAPGLVLHTSPTLTGRLLGWLSCSPAKGSTTPGNPKRAEKNPYGVT